MFGLDGRIASFSDGTTLAIVAAVSIALGLRHASDPDHLAAVTTLIASGKERAARGAARLGFVWGLGHATSLFVFGLPVVLYGAYLPGPEQSAAETTVGFVIVALAVMLLIRWRRGVFHHRHASAPRVHVRTRSARGAYAIGLEHASAPPSTGSRRRSGPRASHSGSGTHSARKVWSPTSSERPAGTVPPCRRPLLTVPGDLRSPSTC